MIAFLDGILAAAGTEAVVQVGGGIGLDVRLSARSADRLPAVGEPVRLWTHLAVREDNWSLYGFVESEERAMFRLLISVSGVASMNSIPNSWLSTVSALHISSRPFIHSRSMFGCSSSRFQSPFLETFIDDSFSLKRSSCALS